MELVTSRQSYSDLAERRGSARDSETWTKRIYWQRLDEINY